MPYLSLLLGRFGPDLANTVKVTLGHPLEAIPEIKQAMRLDLL